MRDSGPLQELWGIPTRTLPVSQDLFVGGMVWPETQREESRNRQDIPLPSTDALSSESQREKAE